MTTTLQRIGYWQACLFDDYPLPQEVEGDLPQPLRRELVRHLKGGTLLERYRGYSWCRYGCDGHNGSTELTDGAWVWPEGLAHYVEKHGILLPPELVEHVAAHPQSKGSHEAPLAERSQIEESVWTRWAAQHRRPGFRQALAEARSAALRRVESLMEEEAAALTTREGLGEEACLTAGCGRRVVRETVFCPRCLTEGGREMISFAARGDAFVAFVREAPWKIDA